MKSSKQPRRKSSTTSAKKRSKPTKRKSPSTKEKLVSLLADLLWLKFEHERLEHWAEDRVRALNERIENSLIDSKLVRRVEALEKKLEAPKEQIVYRWNGPREQRLGSGPTWGTATITVGAIGDEEKCQTSKMKSKQPIISRLTQWMGKGWSRICGRSSKSVES